MIKGIIFDFGGTVAFKDKGMDVLKTCELLRKHGYDVYHQEWDAAYKYVFFIEFPKGKLNSYEDFVRRTIEVLGFKPKEAAVKEITSYWKSHDDFEFFPDVKHVQHLNMRKAILTTIPYFRISRLDLTGFDPVMTGIEIGHAKPHPEGFLKILRRWKLKPEEVLMVGNDMEIDINPAKRLGIKTAFIDREGNAKAKADYIIHSMKDLAKILK